jgi:hypothetical protein
MIFSYPRWHPGFRSAEWYYSNDVSTGLNTPAAALLYLYEVVFPEPVPIQALGWKVTTAGGAGAQIKGAFWSSGGGTRPIGTPVGALNTPVAATGTGGVSGAITPGVAHGSTWFGTTVDPGALMPVLQGLLSSDSRGGSRIGASSLANAVGAATNNQTQNHLTVPFTFTDNIAALNLTGASFTGGATAVCPIVLFQRAA